MIHLDTNYLIGLSKPDFNGRNFLLAMQQGEAVAVSAMAWHEFLCGPELRVDVDFARFLVQERILPVDRDAAEFGAALFNKTGRRRGSSADCMIAAVAILHSATFFTFNTQDFLPFVPLGLRLG